MAPLKTPGQFIDVWRMKHREAELDHLNGEDAELAAAEDRVRDRRIRERRWRDKWGRRGERAVMVIILVFMFIGFRALEEDDAALRDAIEFNCAENAEQDDNLKRLVQISLAAGEGRDLTPAQQEAAEEFQKFVDEPPEECPPDDLGG